MKALNTLNAKDFSEMRTFTKPPKEVARVMAAVLILLSPGKTPTRDTSWRAALNAMKKGADAFLQTLKDYKKEEIPPSILSALKPYVEDEKFEGKHIRQKSVAAAGLCDWVVNIVKVRIHIRLDVCHESLDGICH